MKHSLENQNQSALNMWGETFPSSALCLKHTCLQDQEQTTLEGEKGTGKNGIGSPYSLVTHNDVLMLTMYSTDRMCTD